MRRLGIDLPDQDLAYLREGTEHFDDYVEAVHWAQEYARTNRELMMTAVLEALRRREHLPPFEARLEAVNCHHNYVARERHFGEDVLVTRKGAVRAGRGDLGIIPGSMGTRSFIVRGLGNEQSFSSCSHGAGRAMSRTEARRRFSVEDHAAATTGIECRKDADVIDETPMAYKSIDGVMQAQRDLVEIAHTLRQVVCVKGMTMLLLDGSEGEGGGQILRSALALSLVTGTPFRIDGIRAGRPRPGLMRQHLTAVEAAAAVGRAEVTGAEVGSRSVSFRPGRPRGGDYHFSVGTAGSATLVLQTVLPALITAEEPSTLVLEGGTHNPTSPPFDFLAAAYLPLVGRMGPRVSATLERPGFYPAGGGRLRVVVAPVRDLTPLVLDARGAIVSRRARAVVANLPRSIAEREVAQLARRLGWESAAFSIEERADSAGPGNVVLVEVQAEQVTDVFSGFGEKNVRAETVADRVADEALAYLAGEQPVGPHLADQLVLLLALARGGSFRTTAPTMHTRTQLAVVERFLGPVVRPTEEAPGRWRFVGVDAAGGSRSPGCCKIRMK